MMRDLVEKEVRAAYERGLEEGRQQGRAQQRFVAACGDPRHAEAARQVAWIESGTHVSRLPPQGWPATVEDADLYVEDYVRTLVVGEAGSSADEPTQPAVAAFRKMITGGR
jgi:hypothetical protein